MRAIPMRQNALGLLLPGGLLIGLAVVIAAQTIPLTVPVSAGASLAPETVIVPAHAFSYRAPGDFQRGKTAIDGPLISVAAGEPLEIMTYQVSAADYARCVADDACDKADPRRHGTGNVPVTGVSFDDAGQYAAWLSAETGEAWRLPTVAEWAFAAGSKAVDPALGTETDADNPADRWLALYDLDSARAAASLATPQPLGSSGVNEFGVADLAGAVWEWTATCGGRTTLDAAGQTVSHLDSCGVRYVEGGHRAAMSHFIRDAQGGGCSAGAPPDNLGFRLVREPGWIERVMSAFGRIFARGA
ncbi:MAG: SUMF1/EgtB/PvdO family nonheme iron enzyme [Devosia nanyangense]|uniref:SUMF1/EgtB/PvdO family nonheme iron enzyme n=1 Tax=Devosia nanyangense TaxID=1228055 RepID=A0A933L1Q2_9HYPH|nr:SUMF1/EgtB/PvdO family nonheme iron enzyme [Devosia nanyangense]